MESGFIVVTGLRGGPFGEAVAVEKTVSGGEANDATDNNFFFARTFFTYQLLRWLQGWPSLQVRAHRRRGRDATVYSHRRLSP